MKRLTSQQIQNILFTLVVVLAALVVYLLTGWNKPSSAQAVEPPPTPTATPRSAAQFESVPEGVFSMLMTSDEKFLAKVDKQDSHTIRMQCGSAGAGNATLTFTADEDGKVSSFMITFQMPDAPPTKTKTPEEKTQLQAYEKFVSAQNVAVQTILLAAVDACDLNGLILSPVSLKWYAGALSARDSGKNYKDTYRGCIFEAYQVKIGAKDSFVCTFLIGQ